MKMRPRGIAAVFVNRKFRVCIYVASVMVKKISYGTVVACMN